MKPKDEPQQALDDWADRIAALEPDVVAGVATQAKRLAADRRLPAADRRFAKAQADAIARAVRRVASSPPASKRPARRRIPSRRNATH